MGLRVSLPSRKQQPECINDINLKEWKKEIREKNILLGTLWIFSRREKTGVHTNYYWGNFIPQIPYQALIRYTRSGDWVLDPFAGSGTTLITCKQINRNAIGVELVPRMVALFNWRLRTQANKQVFAKIIQGDCTSVEARKRVEDILASQHAKQVQLIILHPPYFNIICFSSDPSDLSNAPSIPIFLKKLRRVVRNFADLLEEGRYMILVMGDVYSKGECIPLGFMAMNEIKRAGKFKVKAIIVKNITNNRGKFGQEHLWQYRALKNGLYIFKHEYIFVFQKV